jgi:hypothetical protein
VPSSAWIPALGTSRLVLSGLASPSPNHHGSFSRRAGRVACSRRVPRYPPHIHWDRDSSPLVYTPGATAREALIKTLYRPRPRQTSPLASPPFLAEQDRGRLRPNSCSCARSCSDAAQSGATPHFWSPGEASKSQSTPMPARRSCNAGHTSRASSRIEFSTCCCGIPGHCSLQTKWSTPRRST